MADKVRFINQSCLKVFRHHVGLRIFSLNTDFRLFAHHNQPFSVVNYSQNCLNGHLFNQSPAFTVNCPVDTLAFLLFI